MSDKSSEVYLASLSLKQVKKRVRSAINASLQGTRRVSDKDSLVLDLGYDSLRLATLSIELEREFDTPLLLTEWVSLFDDPVELTVGSLADYIFGMMQRR